MNNTQLSKPVESSLLFQFFRGRTKDIESPKNEWWTGEAVKHSPDRNEKLVHFVTHGGPSNYRKRFLEEHPGVSLA